MTSSTTQLTFLTGKGRHRAWIARITGRDPQYGLAREFLKGTEFYDNGPRVTYDVPLTENEIYEDWTGDFYVVRDSALAEISRHDKAEILALLDARAKAAEQPAAVDLDAYKGKVERFLRQEGYTTDPRILIDRYPDTIAIGSAGVGPHDCALQLIDNWEHNVPAEGQQDRAPTEAELADVRERYRVASDLMCSTSKTLAEASATNDRVLRNSRVPAKRAAASLAMFEAWKASDAAMQAFRTVEDELQQAEGKRIQAEQAAGPFFIALPTKLVRNEVEAIWGIGRTAEEAWGDAWGSLNCRLPEIEEVEGSWQIWNPINQTTEEFPTEEAAQAALKETGFRAEPCTEALYERVKAEGYDAHGRNSYNYVLNGRVYDVEEREAA